MSDAYNDDWDALWEEHETANDANPAQDMRRRLCLRLIGADGEPGRLLDIGSGIGQFIEDAHERWPNAELQGIEMAAKGVEFSRERVPAARFDVVDLIVAPKPPAARKAWATHAVCSEVLEHVDDPVVFMRNARAWLAPGCRVVVTVPGGPISAFDKSIGHRRHFTPQDVFDLLTEAGYEVESSTGSGFPFFNVYRRMVVGRGEKLVQEAEADGAASSSRVVRAGMVVFGPLLWLSSFRSRWGWQRIAVARVPE